MLVKRSLEDVGFEVRNGRVLRGVAPVVPCSDKQEHWRVTQSLRWAGAVRDGAFLVCGTPNKTMQVFDLIAMVQLVQPKVSVETTETAGRLKCVLEDGTVFQWDDLKKRGFVRIANHGIWIDAESPEDMAFQIQSGKIARHLEIDCAISMRAAGTSTRFH